MRTNIFQNTKTFNCDIYVGDYTEYSKRNKQYKGIGVKFSNAPLPDLNALHINNPYSVSVTTVNFEDNASVFVNSNGRKVSQCEGMCCTTAQGYDWVLLIELKYCLAKNIRKNANKAASQIKSTCVHLKRVHNFFEKKDNLFCIISIPDHSNLIPFQKSLIAPHKCVELKRKFNLVIFVGVNELEIASSTHIVVP